MSVTWDLSKGQAEELIVLWMGKSHCNYCGKPIDQGHTDNCPVPFAIELLSVHLPKNS